MSESKQFRDPTLRGTGRGRAEDYFCCTRCRYYYVLSLSTKYPQPRPAPSLSVLYFLVRYRYRTICTVLLPESRRLDWKARPGKGPADGEQSRVCVHIRSKRLMSGHSRELLSPFLHSLSAAGPPGGNLWMVVAVAASPQAAVRTAPRVFLCKSRCVGF